MKLVFSKERDLYNYRAGSVMPTESETENTHMLSMTIL